MFKWKKMLISLLTVSVTRGSAGNNRAGNAAGKCIYLQSNIIRRK